MWNFHLMIKKILISTRTNMLMLVDAFEGNVIATFESFDNSENKDCYGIFTPDNNFICVPENNGDIHLWDLQKRQDIIWRGHPKRVEKFLFNPKYCMAISAAQHFAIWLPDFKKIESYIVTQDIKDKNGMVQEDINSNKFSIKEKGKN